MASTHQKPWLPLRYEGLAVGGERDGQVLSAPVRRIEYLGRRHGEGCRKGYEWDDRSGMWLEADDRKIGA